MPFVKRTIHPKNVRRHGPLGNYLVFEDHDEVSHHSLVNVLKQLSSLTWNAESIFKEIEIESNALSQRCTQVQGRLERLSQNVTHLNPKEVEIPVSTLEIEQKIPFYLHYRSSDLQDEDLFTVDSRNPSLIHLHQNARSDWNGFLRGSTAYSKSTRPRSLDPSLLIDDAEPSSVGCAISGGGGGAGMNGGSRFSNAKSTANIVASPELTELFSPRGILPTPHEKVQQECSQKIGKVISVDTSGSQYDRKVSYRKSQRLSCSGASVVKRRKNQQKYRDRHKTLTALPGSILHDLEISSASTNRSSAIEHVVDRSQHHQSARPLSVATNNHVITSSTSLRGNSMKFPFLPFRRNTKHRNTIAGTDVVRSLPEVDDVTQLDATSNHKSPSANGGAPMVAGANRDIVTSQEDKGRDIREFVDRTSSGFWSGTESARHSTTSDTVNNNNKAAIKPKSNDITTFGNGIIGVIHDKDRNGSHHEICAPSLSASTTSINSRLSTFDTTSEISSVFHETPNGTLPPSKHFFPCSPSPLITSAYERSQLLKTPPGSYRYMNGDYDPEENGGGRPFLKHEIDSPLDPIIIDGRHHSGFSSLFRPRKNQNGEAPPSYYGTSSFGTSSSPPPSTKPTTTTTNGDEDDGSDEFERRKRQLQRKHQQQQEQLLMQQREEEARLLKMQESSRSPRLSDFTPAPKSPTPKQEQQTNGYHHNTSSSTNGSDVADSTTPKECHGGGGPVSTWRLQRNQSMTSPTPSSTTNAEKPAPPRRWSSLHGSSPLHDAKQIMAILESPPKRKNRCSSVTSSASTLSSPPCSVTPSRVNSVTSSKRSSTPESSSSSSALDHEDTTPTNHTPPLHDLSRLEMPQEKSDDVIIATAESICDTPNIPPVTGGGVKNLFKSQSVRQREIPKPTTTAKPSRSSLKLTSSGSVVTSSSPAASAQKAMLSPTRAAKKPLIMGEKPKSKPKPPPPTTQTAEKIEIVLKRTEQQNKDEKSPSVTSPKRPAIKPKPVVLPKPKFLRQSSREVEEVVSKTANARAAFFGLPTPTTPPSGSNPNSPRGDAPTSPKKVEAAPSSPAAPEQESDDVFDHVIHSLQKESSSTSLNESDSTTPNPIATSTPETTLQNNSDVTTPMDDVKLSDSSSYVLATRSLPEFVVSDDDTSSVLSSASMLSNLSGSGVRLRPKFIVPLKDGSGERTSSPSSRLKQTRYSNGSNLNGLKSPLSKSPSSTLERKPRYSTTSLERRRKNGTTSRNDFKALLMQSTTSRSASNNMSAAEKLKLTSPANKPRTTSSDDLGSASRISDMNGRRASTSNIQSATMRTGRYSSRGKNEIRWSYGGGPLNFSLSKKHPPLSHSGRYTAIRSRTPTRVMNSISEDADEYSPELGTKLLMKSMVNVRSETDV